MKKIGFPTFRKHCRYNQFQHHTGHENCSYGIEASMRNVPNMLGSTHAVYDYYCDQKLCPIFNKLRNAK